MHLLSFRWTASQLNGFRVNSSTQWCLICVDKRSTLASLNEKKVVELSTEWDPYPDRYCDIKISLDFSSAPELIRSIVEAQSEAVNASREMNESYGSTIRKTNCNHRVIVNQLACGKSVTLQCTHFSDYLLPFLVNTEQWAHNYLHRRFICEAVGRWRDDGFSHKFLIVFGCSITVSAMQQSFFPSVPSSAPSSVAD